MIQAERRELEASRKKQEVGIREQELKLFTEQLSVLATSATFMSSICFAALNMEIGFIERDDGEYCSSLIGCDKHMMRVTAPMFVFYLGAALGLTLNLLAVVLASTSMILGPELAIRGSRESLRHVIREMYLERGTALHLHLTGGVFVLLSGAALAFLRLPSTPAIIVATLFALLLVFCLFYSRRLAPKFAYAPQKHTDKNDVLADLTGNHDMLRNTDASYFFFMGGRRRRWRKTSDQQHVDQSQSRPSVIELATFDTPKSTSSKHNNT